MNFEVQNLVNDMDKVLEHEVSQRHSYFQLKYFLIGKEPTMQSKMWQCLREMKTRRETLRSIKLELEDLKDKLELLDIKSKRIEQALSNSANMDDLSRRENEIELRRIERQKTSLLESQQSILEREKWTLEESRFFLETFKNLEKIEPLKHHDDLESQKQYWAARLTQKLNLKLLSKQAMDTDLVETIMALPDDMEIKKQVVNTLAMKQQELIYNLTEAAKRLELGQDKKES
jgi:hypothetical protein